MEQTAPTKLRVRRALTVVLFVAAAALSWAAAAQASSLVFIKNNNVWLANPDGSGQYQVTLDGTSSDPYLYTTQANDGTIMAQRGRGASSQLYLMNQNGTLKAPPFGTATPTSGSIEPVIAPDASKVAYYYTSVACCSGTDTQVQLSYANRFTKPEVFNPSNTLYEYRYPAWLSNSRVALMTTGVDIFDAGAQGVQHWFDWFDLFKDPNGNTGGACYAGGGFWRGALSPDGATLALVNDPSGYSPPYASTCDPAYWNAVSNNASIMFLRTSGDAATGNPPAKPTFTGCLIQPPDGSDGFSGGAPWGTAPSDLNASPLFESLSWSPDGTSVAFEYNGSTYVSKIDLGTCDDQTTQVISGATHPFWGPANVNPAPRPAPPSGGSGGGGGGTAGQGGNPGGSGSNTAGGVTLTTPIAATRVNPTTAKKSHLSPRHRGKKTQKKRKHHMKHH